MSERLRLRVEFPPELNELNIYPLLFLPLVENAFKYVGGDYQLDIIMKWEITGSVVYTKLHPRAFSGGRSVA